jgi:pilus assembly protein CpaE
LLYASSASKNPDLILAAMRAGISEYLGKPLEDGEFRRAIEKAVRIRQTDAQRVGQTGQVAAVFSKKGGLGVTTIAVNLATALSASEAAPTVIVDMSFDLGDVASFLDLRPEYTVADLLDKGGNVDAGKLQSCLSRHPSGLYYFGERESTNEAESIAPSQVRQIIAHLSDSFSHVILDLPHTFDTLTYEAFEMADAVLLVATADMSTLRATKYALKVFRTLGYDERKVEIVLNRVSKKDTISVAQFERTVEQEVAWEIPNNYKQVIESINVGEPMVTMDRKSNISKSLMRLTERFNAGDNGSGGATARTGN